MLLPSRTAYTHAEVLSDTVIHVAGLVLALIAVPVLLTLTFQMRGDAPALVGVAVYGAAFVAMILCSALYNIFGAVRWSGVLRRLDHAAIYVKIAGTYTPFLILSGEPGGVLLTVVWVAAGTGVALKIASPERFRWVALLLYLGMGWIGLAFGDAMLGRLAPGVLIMILIGGTIYTAGVAFYLFDRLPFHYAIWHGFVLAASLVFYAAVTVQMLATAT